MHRRIVLLFFLIGIVDVLSAQSLKKDIQVLAKSKKEGIWLRWAPTNPTIWQLGNKYGYVVERFTLKPNGDLEKSQGTKLSAEPLKPLSAADFEKLSGTVKDATVLGELIYGKETSVSGDSKSITNILAKKEEDENIFGVALLVCDLSIDLAQAAGLFIKDNTALFGQRYIYRVSLAQKPKEFAVEPGVVVVTVTDEKPLLEIKNLSAEFRDYTVMLSWPTLFHQGTYSFYYIEKSTDGNAFNKVSEMPYAHMSETPDAETAFFVDSLTANAKTFYYRIKGVTPFGEIGPPSNVVKGEGKDNLSGLLIIREGKVVDDSTIKKQETKAKNKKQLPSAGANTSNINLTWEFPVEAENQINGFIVFRAPGADGPYVEASGVLPKNVRSFSDKTSLNNTYFQVSAVDKLKNEVSRSYPFLVQVEDNTPPAAPSNITGLVDSVGIVSLSWMANADIDLMGYRVFRSNALAEDPVEVTKVILTQPVFTDSVNIRVLNREIFYHIVAVDKNYNASSYSTALKLLRPDIIPPAPPVFTRTEIRRDTLLLEWTGSASADITKYELIRLEEGQPTKTVLTWTSKSLKLSHSDWPLTPGKKYQYKIAAYDSAGNTSSSVTRRIEFEPGFRKAVTGLKAEVSREGKAITLRWKNSEHPVGVLVFRKENSSSYKLHMTLEGEIEVATDKLIRFNNSYSYKIQGVYSGGIKSILSEAISVKY